MLRCRGYQRVKADLWTEYLRILDADEDPALRDEEIADELGFDDIKAVSAKREQASHFIEPSSYLKFLGLWPE